MEKMMLEMSVPARVNVTVKRSTRPRDYLTEREIEKLIEAAGDNRWGHRDAKAILIAYRHGLRSSELVSLRWDDPASCVLTVTPVLTPSHKPIASDGHPRQAYSAGRALAEWLCRTANRIDPA